MAGWDDAKLTKLLADRAAWLGYSQERVMSDHKLILHPQNPNIGIVDVSHFASELHSIGLITGDIRKPNETYFKPGCRFLELIEFTQNRRALIFDKGGIGEVVDNCTRCSVQLIDYGAETKFHGINEYTDK